MVVGVERARHAMNNIIRNILAIIVGLALGGIVNMALVSAGPRVFPPPPGVDMRDVKSLAESVRLLEPRHFVFPWLGHAAGTLAGAWVAYRLAGSRPAALAFAIGGFFLLGGIAAASMIPAPAWFVALDLFGAYLPMAWLATRLGRRRGDPGGGGATDGRV